MKLAVGADERFQIVDAVLAMLAKQGHTTEFYGPTSGQEPHPWPEAARQVAGAVTGGKAKEDIHYQPTRF